MCPNPNLNCSLPMLDQRTERAPHAMYNQNSRFINNRFSNQEGAHSQLAGHKPSHGSNSHVDQSLQNPKKIDEEKAMAKEQQECDPRFQLLEKLGEGTYGVVYKAIDTHLKQVSLNFSPFPIQFARSQI